MLARPAAFYTGIFHFQNYKMADVDTSWQICNTENIMTATQLSSAITVSCLRFSLSAFTENVAACMTKITAYRP